MKSTILLQCSELNHFATLLSHFMILSAILLQCTQPFCHLKFKHCRGLACHSATVNVVVFTTVLSHFMILSVILEILSDILLHCLIILIFYQLFLRSCQSFCYRAKVF
jgi:hypothetical protein